MSNEMPDLSEIEFDEAFVPSYEDMNSQELLDCLAAHDAHHNEHHAREEALLAENRAMREALEVAREVLGRFENNHIAAANFYNRRECFANSAGGMEASVEFSALLHKYQCEFPKLITKINQTLGGEND